MRRRVPRDRPHGAVRLLLLAIPLLAWVGCGDAPDAASPAPEGAAIASSADGNRPPRIDDLSLEPGSPVIGDSVRVVATVRDPEGDPVKMTYEWRLAGQPVGNGTAKLVLKNAVRGDLLEVSVVASDGRADSEPASVRTQVSNQPPTVERLGMGPSWDVTAGELIEVAPSARDAEGDELSFHYRWLVNGRPADAPDLPEFDTTGLEKGDLVRVEVIPDDGRDEGEPFLSPDVRVANRPPAFVSTPVRSFPGGEFSYTVKAQDPDGDSPLRYELDEAPEGMEIGTHSGKVTWRPAPGQTGTHRIRVIVDDDHGGRVAHAFDLAVGDASPPAAAAAR